MFKTLHFADIHCKDSNLEEIKKCCDCILKTAREENPDLIVNAGDTFDSQSIKLDSEASRYMFLFHSQLTQIAPVVAVLGTPSHDGKAALALEYKNNGNCRIAVSELIEQFILYEGNLYHSGVGISGKPDAIISTLPAPTKQFFQTQAGIEQADIEIGNAIGAILAGFGATASKFDCPHILVGHFQVGGSYISETQQLTGRDIEVSKDQIELAKADFVCLGHIHYPQQIGENIFYAGSVTTLNWGEMHKHGFYIHETGQKPHFYETPAKKLVKVEIDTARDGFENTVAPDLLRIANISQEELSGAFVRVEIKVYQDEVAKIDKEAIKSFYLSAAQDVDIKLIRVPRENTRSKTILKLSSLREKIIERASLNNETVPGLVLDMADNLEALPAQEFIEYATYHNITQA